MKPGRFGDYRSTIQFMLMRSRRAPSEFAINLLLERRPTWLRSERLGLVCHPASVN
jgi:hypothetical protein